MRVDLLTLIGLAVFFFAQTAGGDECVTSGQVPCCQLVIEASLHVAVECEPPTYPKYQWLHTDQDHVEGPVPASHGWYALVNTPGIISNGCRYNYLVNCSGVYSAEQSDGDCQPQTNPNSPEDCPP